MKKNLFTLFLLLLSASALISQNPDFSLVGYGDTTGDNSPRSNNTGRAGIHHTTTGGEGSNPQVVTYTGNDLRDVLRSGDYMGGMIYEIYDADMLAGVLLEFTRHHRNSNYSAPYQPVTFYIKSNLTNTGSTREIRIEDTENVSIIGMINGGEKADFHDLGIRIIRCSNVIVRNLRIYNVRQGASTGTEIAYSNNIWIDRNEYHSEGLLPEIHRDYYDGLLDIKHQSNAITVSWNIFRDHYKGLLLGHSDSPSAAPDNITYHHNLFLNLNTRAPLIRFANVHMFNNVFENIQGSATNCRMGAVVRIENNHYINAGSGTVDSQGNYQQGAVGWWYGSSTGYWHLIDNIFDNSPLDDKVWQNNLSSTSVPYEYAHVLHPAQDIYDLVYQFAGRVQSYEPDEDATLSALYIGDILADGFSPSAFEYSHEVPFGTPSAPTVSAITAQSEAGLSISQATSLPGTATVHVTSANGQESNTYTVQFTMYDPSDDATLAGITIDGEPIEGFSSTNFNYTIDLPFGSPVPVVNATLSWHEAGMAMYEAGSIPGTNSIQVTSADGTESNIYYIIFTQSDPSADATLSEINVNGSLISGFSPSQTNYTINIPDSEASIPQVSAVVNDELASVEINQADDLPGVATVEVTAQDGSKQTYTVTFTVTTNWLIYDASALPGSSSPSFSASDFDNPSFSLVDDTDGCIDDNQLLKLEHTSPSSKGNWRYDFPSGQIAVTIVARVKALPGAFDKVMVIDMQFAGSRERIYINSDNTYWLRHAGAGSVSGPNEQLPNGADINEWNIIRLTKQGHNVNFYLNEHPVPVESVVTGTSTNNNYFRFGDPFGDQTSGALIDWIIWDETGAYAPGEGSPIPSWICSTYGDNVSTVTPDYENQQKVDIYPNPVTNGLVNIALTGFEGNKKIKLLNLSGTVISISETSANSYVLPVNLPTGIYLIQINNADFGVTKRLIVR
ncbi:pectate lyase family protein [Alkalitalea saponilacus]|uniref:Por secretion system C-terminal sorting domain-containing protein n=1 Tax=Alkalitalea saponilacus TaxID=889453 RepID=A0A1T5HTK5_9BACT|nr:T9SS type A sorting domain-containing protein [Alkalitalea saponilacus]ASB49190.1 hypothetical protein CDL62_08580 [Alkalitalea saponilacus]SKC23984.1 Por secretion system C-terminal sorting domain-containing protein [Alkalitalea saponilacus]